MSRSDISPVLIHFTSGEDEDDAFVRLRKIIAERRLIAGSHRIKGAYNCVCFSEAPLTSLKSGLVNEANYSNYSPFGIIVSKKWLFDQGGRPVIYQPKKNITTSRKVTVGVTIATNSETPSSMWTSLGNANGV